VGDKTYERAFTEILERECLNYREEQRETLIDRISDTARAIYRLHLEHVYLGRERPPECHYKFKEEFSRLQPKDILDKLKVVPLAIQISNHLKTFETLINSDGDPKTLKETIEAITINLRKIHKIFPDFTQRRSRNFLTECLEMATECSALIDTFISEGFSFGENNKKIQKPEIDILASLRQNLKSSISGVFIFQERIPKYFGANGTAETLAEIRTLDFPSQEQARQRFDSNLREKEQKYIQLADQIVSIWKTTKLPRNWENDDSTSISLTDLQTKLEEIFVNLNAMESQSILGMHFYTVNNTMLLRIRRDSSEFINLLTVLNALDDPKNLKIPEITLDDEVVVVEPSPEATPTTDTALEEKSSPAPVPPRGDPLWAFLAPSFGPEKQ
jgi:hypothetical protein